MPGHVRRRYPLPSENQVEVPMIPRPLLIASGLLAVVVSCTTTPVKVGRVPVKAGARFTTAYLDISQVDVPPRPTRAKAPLCLENRGDGYAVVQYIVDASGMPREVQCVEASDAVLGRAAETTIARWRFDAAQKGGRAVASRMEQRFEFRFAKDFSLRGSPVGNPAPAVTRYAEETPTYSSAGDPFDRGTYQHQ